MGAAEWTGYSNSTPSYQSYSSLSSVAVAPTSSSAYGFEASVGGMVDHPSNFHIPTGKKTGIFIHTLLRIKSLNEWILLFLFASSSTHTVISEMQSYCPSDFHSVNHLSPAMNAPLIHSSPSTGSSPPSNAMVPSKLPSEIDAFNAGYSSYNNWSNGYNNYQYACPAAAQTQSQYPTANTQTTPHTPHAAPAMLIYPQVYSTVNQNQIHLHLHGADKIEQYLNPSENGLTISSARTSNIGNGIEIGIGANDSANVIMNAGGDRDTHQTQAHHDQQTDLSQSTTNDDHEVVDPGSVWRPY